MATTSAIEVHGSGGMIRAGNIHETTVETATKAGFATDPVLNFFLERYAQAYRDELAAFIDAIETGKPTSPSGHDGLMAQRLADAATEFWKSGSRWRSDLSQNRSRRNIDRSKRLRPVVTRSATISPTTGTNLKPWPEQAETTSTSSTPGRLSMMKCSSGVLVNMQAWSAMTGPSASGK